MAQLFMLAADCETKEKAEKFAEFFEGKMYKLRDGLVSKVSCDVFEQDDSFWVRACPSGVSKNGGVNATDLNQFSELKKFLYDDLKNAPDFRFALVEVEAESYNSYEGWISDNNENMTNLPPGLVVNQELCEKIDKQEDLVPFKEKYYWFPYDYYEKKLFKRE
ncbi:hypothetical protein ACFLZN_02620 [Nanoarchaeota archaeon]